MTGKAKTAVTVTGLAVVGGVGYYLYKRHKESGETEVPSYEAGQQPEQVAGGTASGGGGGGGASVEPIAASKAEAPASAPAAPAPEKTGVGARLGQIVNFEGPFAPAGVTGSTGTRTGPVHGEPVILHPLEGRAHGGEHVITGETTGGQPRQAERVRVNRTEGSKYPLAQPKRGRR